MRWTRTLIPTQREDPAEAESPSHKLMIRAGLMRKLGQGVFSFLPLGARALHKAAQIVRDELSRAGAVEVRLPILQPPELWQESGRYEAWGDDLLKARDRGGRQIVLAAGHEEAVAHLVRNEVRSYRQLPLTLFQVQTKLRDEARPRGGAVRAREFVTGEAFSFDADDEGLDKEYQRLYDAFVRVLNRAELPYVVADADPALREGKSAQEFLVPTPYGEDEVAHCPKCRYSANSAKAECVEEHGRVNPERLTTEFMPMKEVATPNCSSVEEVAGFLKVTPQQIVKTLILRTEKGYVAALVRGDHEINISKLSRLLRVNVLEMAAPAEVERVSRGAFGFSGPVGLDAMIAADLAIEHMHNFVTGANRADAHLMCTNLHRDFRAQLFGDIRMARAGDMCSRCMAPLDFIKSIEVAHLSKIGTEFSEKMGASFKNERGEVKPMVMGTYAVGIERMVACAVETHCDAAGIRWPKELAPFTVDLLSVNQKDEKIARAAEGVYQKLMAAGVEALWDDRDVTPGVKFTDSDLAGFPVRLTVGKKTLASGTVDLKVRGKEGEISVSVDTVVEAVKNALKDYSVR